MTTITESLNKIWSEFRIVGITDDLVMIEHLARLLLERVFKISIQDPLIINPLSIHTSRNYLVMGFKTDLPDYKYKGFEELTTSRIDSKTNIVLSSILPRSPKEIANLNLESIQEHLDNTLSLVDNDIATLFDKYILFRLPSLKSGGRYPTPRHITKFIYKLAQVKPEHSLADFACGSGGFLVERELTENNWDKTWGVDISPEWIRLAYTNIALQKIPPRLKVGNALDVDIPEQMYFDRILMNPPFGERLDSKLASEKLNKNVGSRSETALTILALQKLAVNGVAAILVPSGLLFSNSKAEKELRETLVEKFYLKAVISLPKDALQPYSSLPSHILLIHNPSSPPEKKSTWFFQLQADGYPSGRSRDLTQPPDLSKSDFPRVEEVLRTNELDLGELDNLGILVASDAIKAQEYDLRTESYLAKPSETLINSSPVELLTRIYRNQKQLTQNLETLFSRIELPPITSQKLPSLLDKTYLPLGKLSDRQKEIWSKILGKTQIYGNGEEENYEIALHFTPEELENGDNGEISDITQRTLELLEAMGLIIPVTLDNKLYYRRITARDLWTDSDSST